MWAISRFRERLAAGERLIGTAVSMADPLISEALADSVDFLWIDLEHSNMSPEVLQGHLLAARGKNCPALVRVPGSEVPFIKPVLDAGAEGIIVPQVRSADEVRRVVDTCRYPPLGHRGYGPRVPSNYGRSGGAEYVARANREVFVIAQIETAEAYRELDDILAIPGLDSLVVGPWDFSGALGRLGDVEHPEVVAAINTVIAKTRAAGKFIGAGMGTDPGYAARFFERGVQWAQVGGDYGLMIRCIEQVTADIRALLGQRDTAAEQSDAKKRPEYR